MPDFLDYQSYPPGFEPRCEVLVEHEGGNRWCQGSVHVWYLLADGWHAGVQYSIESGAHHLARFPAERVRNVESPW
jgi:hypothetical protein